MPSSFKARKAILSLIPESNGPFFELGSGWGTLIFPLAHKFQKNQIKAYEFSPIPYLFSKGIQKVTRIPNLNLVYQDFFKVDLREADGVVCYLFPGAMRKLKQKFIEELKPGAFVVTNTFEVPGWTPSKVIELDDLYRTKIFLYKR